MQSRAYRKHLNHKTNCSVLIDDKVVCSTSKLKQVHSEQGKLQKRIKIEPKSRR